LDGVGASDGFALVCAAVSEGFTPNRDLVVVSVLLSFDENGHSDFTSFDIVDGSSAGGGAVRKPWRRVSHCCAGFVRLAVLVSEREGCFLARFGVWDATRS
jgi:hypothetical protein